MTEQDIATAAEALQRAITVECSRRGGACNSTPDGLLAVSATFDPTEVVRMVLESQNKI